MIPKNKKLPDDLGELIVKKSTVDTLDNQRELQDIEDRTKILDMLLHREESENTLREKFSNKLFWLLAVQVFFVNLIIVGIGASKLIFTSSNYVEWLFRFVIAEGCAFLMVIVKYLFRNDRTETSRKIDTYINQIFDRGNHKKNTTIEKKELSLNDTEYTFEQDINAIQELECNSENKE